MLKPAALILVLGAAALLGYRHHLSARNAPAELCKETYNDLERALRAAGESPAARPAFFKALLDGEVLVIPAGKKLKEGTVTIRKGEALALESVRSGDANYAPFYSSEPRMQARIQADTPYMRLKTRDFFRLTLGSDLLLNAGSDCSFHLKAADVAALLANGAAKN